MEEKNYKKTGTTTVGIKCKDGVILAADKSSGSVWAQGPGLAIEGAYEGQELEPIAIQLFNQDVITKMSVPIWSP